MENPVTNFKERAGHANTLRISMVFASSVLIQNLTKKSIIWCFLKYYLNFRRFFWWLRQSHYLERLTAFTFVELSATFFWTLDFLLLHPHMCKNWRQLHFVICSAISVDFPKEELFSAHVMSLRTHITQALLDNNLVNRAFKSYGWSGMRMTTPSKE